MSFSCPECFTRRSLEIVKRIELPADCRSDEIALQVVTCHACGFSAVATYEESRRGASESFEHVGHKVSFRDLVWLQRLIEECPAVGNSRCTCGCHMILGAKSESGRIELTKRFSSIETFALTI